jgi:hypothetical protein
MHYSITKVIDGIIELDYNGGGMAGSAKKKSMHCKMDNILTLI